MARRSEFSSKPVFHTPMRIDWTDERLHALSQAQLLNLLDNLDHQRRIGRLAEGAAAAIDQRISALLSKSSQARRRKQVEADAAAASMQAQ